MRPRKKKKKEAPMREKQIHNHMRRLLGTLLLAALIATLFVPCVSAANQSGECGVGVKWSFEGNTLTVSGTGAMTNYTEQTPAPWHDFREDIRVLIVQDGVSSVGDLAFYDCKNLVSVMLADTVKTIGYYSFAECKRLKILSLGQGLDTIGRSAFEYCESLQSVRLPSFLRTIGERAFYRCAGLRTVTVPASVSTLGVKAFAYCTGLISAEINASISKLPAACFYGCEKLTELTLSSTVTKTDGHAFYDCENISKIYFSGSITDGEQLADSVQDSLPSFSDSQIVYETNTEKGKTEVKDVDIKDDTVVSETVTVNKTDNSTISTTVTSKIEVQDSVVGETQTTVKIEAVIEKEEGWKELVDEIKEGTYKADEGTKVQVDVSLNDSKEITGSTLNDLAGKDVNLTIDMKDGSSVKIDCERLEKIDEEAKIEVTALSYQLVENENPTKHHIKTIGDAKSFLLSFDGSSEFDFSPRIYVGRSYAYQIASLYQYIPGRGLSLLQSVKLDKDGYATYYLRSTKSTTQYLIALNVKDVSEESAIIPEDMAADYGNMMYYETIQYVQTGVRMFMGLSLFQFSIAVGLVMVFLFIAVGIVMSVLYRKRKLELYYQQLKERNS